ncbi:MAG: cell envelope integrity protein CreD [Pseudomonadota bacterium]
MNWSVGFRFLVVGVLALLMYVPLFLVGGIIESRVAYSRATIAEVGHEWGGRQTLVGPRLIIPVKGPVTREEQRMKIDPVSGERSFELVDVTQVQRKAPVHVLPEQFDMAIAVQGEERSRGIFKVPVYSADLTVDFDYRLEEAALGLAPDETILWDEAFIDISLTSNRALRGRAELLQDGAPLLLEPSGQTEGGRGGIAAAVGDPRKAASYRLTMGINGAQDLMLAPVGRSTKVEMTSDWPHPSFSGAFLPNGSALSDKGFTASWEIPHLARSVPQISRADLAGEALGEAFGVRFYQPNDFYQKAYRAANYGLLFIALTFLTILLIERAAKIAVHPVQYVMMGLAQAVFVLLMVSFAEQIGFAAAYALSSGATIALLVTFGFAGLRLGRMSWTLGLMLAALYGVLFLILRTAEYALLAGAVLAFFALAGTMYATRNEQWFATGGQSSGWFTRRSKPVPAD